MICRVVVINFILLWKTRLFTHFFVAFFALDHGNCFALILMPPKAKKAPAKVEKPVKKKVAKPVKKEKTA